MKYSQQTLLVAMMYAAQSSDQTLALIMFGVFSVISIVTVFIEK